MQVPAVEPTGHRDAVFGLVERDGSLLLVSNPRVIAGSRPDTWDLPGGAVRPGESLEEALVREWHEETGLAAEVGELRLVVDGVKQTTDGALLYTWRAFVFRVACEGEPSPGEGITEAAWVPRAEALERLDAPYHQHLRRLLAGEAVGYERLTWTEPAAPEPSAGTVPRRLLVVAAAASVGDRELLARELRAAAEAGEAPARLVETLLQIVPYAGYPRTITAFGVLRATLPDASPASELDEDRAASAARGHATFQAVYGEKAEAIEAGLAALDPVLARWTLEHAYGRVLAREGTLTLVERELLAVAILTALGGLAEPLLGHMRACVRLGCAAEQVGAAVACVPASVGEARRGEARALLARLDPPRAP